MVKSFFDPHWMDLGLLGEYGRLSGINWVWSISLVLYHATVSIAIPISLVEMIYPGRRDETWLKPRGRIGFSLLLAADVAFGYLALTTYRPPFLPYIFAIASVLILAGLGWRMPHHFQWNAPTQVWKSFWLGVLGFIGITAFFLCSWALPEWGISPWLTCLGLVGGSYIFLRIAWHASGGGRWDDRGRFALASGVLMFFILLAPLSKNDPSRMDNPAGMTLVALITLVGLVFLRTRIHRRAGLDHTLSKPCSEFAHNER